MSKERETWHKLLDQLEMIERDDLAKKVSFFFHSSRDEETKKKKIPFHFFLFCGK